MIYAKNTGRGTKLREASYEDYAQIAALESRYGLGIVSPERRHHIWKNNPEYPGASAVLEHRLGH